LCVLPFQRLFTNRAIGEDIPSQEVTNRSVLATRRGIKPCDIAGILGIFDEGVWRSHAEQSHFALSRRRHGHFGYMADLRVSRQRDIRMRPAQGVD
jgi:hypothetical protein